MTEAPLAAQIKWAVDKLAGRVAEPRLEAEVLLAAQIGMTRVGLLARLTEDLPAALTYKFRRQVRRRARGYPLQYLTGEQDFMSLPLKVAPGVLIPRAETELLVETVIGLVGDRCVTVVDVGTGTGAIALALSHYLPCAQVVAVDIVPRALRLCRLNARRLNLADRVEIISGDLLEPLMGVPPCFDVVVANLPYVAPGERIGREVYWEPRRALAGGSRDGLAVYRRLVPQAGRLLVENGLLVLETGTRQGGMLAQLLDTSGFRNVQVRRDYAGRERVVLGYRAKGAVGRGLASEEP